MAMICSLCSGVMLTGQASAVAQFNASLNAAQGAMMTAILAVFSCVGRLGLGTLSDKVGRYNLYLIILFVTALDMIFVFNSAHTFGTFLLALAPPALGFGGMMAMLPGLAADNFDPQNFSVNYPFLFTAYTLCSLVGPMLASFVLELDGNYDRAMVFAGILAVIGFVLVLVAKGLSRKMAVNATMPE